MIWLSAKIEWFIANETYYRSKNPEDFVDNYFLSTGSSCIALWPAVIKLFQKLLDPHRNLVLGQH